MNSLPDTRRVLRTIEPLIADVAYTPSCPLAVLSLSASPDSGTLPVLASPDGLVGIRKETVLRILPCGRSLSRVATRELVGKTFFPPREE